jgi:addiction module RelB/DinJ family antitoxin
MNNSARKFDTVKVNANLKNQAENIFKEVGITSSEAINTFFVQVISAGNYPLKPKKKKQGVPRLTEAFIDAKLKEAEDDFKINGETYDAFEVLEELKKEYAL